MIRLLRYYFLVALVFPWFRRHHFFTLFGTRYCIGPDRFGWFLANGGGAFYVSNALRDSWWAASVASREAAQ